MAINAAKQGTEVLICLLSSLSSLSCFISLADKWEGTYSVYKMATLAPTCPWQQPRGA